RTREPGLEETPVVRYATAPGGGSVAYEVVGDGPIDVLVTRTIFFPVDLMWDEPRIAYFLNRLSSFSRHIWYDPRGMGASDWIPHSEGQLFESGVDDMVAVLDRASVASGSSCWRWRTRSGCCSRRLIPSERRH